MPSRWFFIRRDLHHYWGMLIGREGKAVDIGNGQKLIPIYRSKPLSKEEKERIEEEWLLWTILLGGYDEEDWETEEYEERYSLWERLMDGDFKNREKETLRRLS